MFSSSEWCTYFASTPASEKHVSEPIYWWQLQRLAVVLAWLMLRWMSDDQRKKGIQNNVSASGKATLPWRLFKKNELDMLGKSVDIGMNKWQKLIVSLSLSALLQRKKKRKREKDYPNDTVQERKGRTTSPVPPSLETNAPSPPWWCLGNVRNCWECALVFSFLPVTHTRSREASLLGELSQFT